MGGCLPAGAGEDASPLGLRPVGAAQHGEDPTHGGAPRKEAEWKPRELQARGRMQGEQRARRW
jgi:hypothetical protein